MSDSATLTVRIDSSVKQRLESLAKATRRSESALAAEGIEAFIELEERQIEGIKQALASLDRGESVSHEAVEAWVASMDTANELPMPKAE